MEHLTLLQIYRVLRELRKQLTEEFLAGVDTADTTRAIRETLAKKRGVEGRLNGQAIRIRKVRSVRKVHQLPNC